MRERKREGWWLESFYERNWEDWWPESFYEREIERADGQNHFMREKLRGLMASMILWERNWEGPHTTDSVASEWGDELAEGQNLTVATAILWACHGNGPNPSWVGQRVVLMMGARGWVHEITEWCTSGAREYRVVHERCPSMSCARDGCTRVRSGARVVHESSTSSAR